MPHAAHQQLSTGLAIEGTPYVSQRSSQVSQFANGCTVWPRQVVVGAGVVVGVVVTPPDVVVVVVAVGIPTYSVEEEVV